MAWSAEARLDNIATNLGEIAERCDDVFTAELGEDVLEIRHALMNVVARHRQRRHDGWREACAELDD